MGNGKTFESLGVRVIGSSWRIARNMEIKHWDGEGMQVSHTLRDHFKILIFWKRNKKIKWFVLK